MTENETVQTKSVEIGMLNGQINGVKVEVYSEFGDGNHQISFRLSTVNYGDSEIKRSGHTHPWGDNLTQDMEKYTADAQTVREEAWTELERRNLDNPDDWHDRSV